MKQRWFMRISKRVADSIGLKEGWILVEETKPNRVKPIRQATRIEGALLSAIWSARWWVLDRYRRAYWYVRREWQWLLVWGLQLVLCGIILYLLIKKLELLALPG